MSVNFNFKGKVALITGSSSGIGAGIAILFAESGADVVVTGLEEEEVANVGKQCLKVSENKSNVLQVVADITKKEETNRLIQTTIEKFGRLDILVNCAGMAQSAKLIDQQYMDITKNIFDINFNSILYLTQLCVEYLAKTKGNIINISSVLGIQANPLVSSYCMSKSALDMFTRCMAVELRDKRIRVNSVNPGMIETPIITKMGDKGQEMIECFAKQYPVGRVGQPQDIANMVLFLASERAQFITGSNVVVDGGHLAASAVPNLG